MTMAEQTSDKRFAWVGDFVVDLVKDAARLLLAVLLLGLVLTWTAKECHAQVPQAASRYKHELRQQSQFVWGVDAPVASFAAQIHQESRWNSTAHSPVGAEGLAQFMPSTAGWIAEAYPNLRASDPYNPAWAIRALVQYDRHLWDRIRAANGCERMAFSMSAYNGGLGWVYKRQARSQAPGICLNGTCEINPGISASNQRENVAYPRRILLQHEPLYVSSGWGRGSCT